MHRTPIGDTALTFTRPVGVAWSAAAWADALRASDFRGVTDVVAAFDRVTVIYDPAAMPSGAPIDRLAAWARGVADGLRDSGIDTPRTIELPVRYGGGDGPDLAPLAAAVGLDVNATIAMHADADYAVAAVGFLPGFAYLDGLPGVLKVARRRTPRLRVAAGSVAVGGPYTGVYPVASPGGWHVIGRTPAVLFDPARPDAAPLRVGDRVRFVPQS